MRYTLDRMHIEPEQPVEAHKTHVNSTRVWTRFKPPPPPRRQREAMTLPTALQGNTKVRLFFFRIVCPKIEEMQPLIESRGVQGHRVILREAAHCKKWPFQCRFYAVR